MANTVKMHIVIDQGIRKHFAERTKVNKCIELREIVEMRVCNLNSAGEKKTKQKSHDTQTSHHEAENDISITILCACDKS